MAKPIGRQEFLQLAAALLGGSLIGCDDGGGSDAGGGGSDSGPRADAGGGGGTDAGGGGTDAGGGGTDAGGGGTDAGGGGTDAGGGGNMCSGDRINAVIGSNHAGGLAHALSIPVADIVAGVDMTYTTGGTTSHCHSVTVTAADFAMLRAGGEVRLYSCNNTDHEYVLSCVGTPTSDAMNPIPICGTLGGSFGAGTCP
ncbi:MAG: hypothetical protein AB7S26_21755 [Sandaracinaceae bacterium]